MNRYGYPHRRYNPLTEEWVLCSPHRTKRPWQGQVEKPAAEQSPTYDPGCYLCPGNTRVNGERNPDYRLAFVFANDYAALIANDDEWEENKAGLLIARAEPGVCRVICFSPRHDLSLPLMEQSAIRSVVDTWADQAEALGADQAIQYVQVFENKGAVMGCSNPHPHCQIWATRHIPTIPSKKLQSQRKYHAGHGTDLLGDYLSVELKEKERLVDQNDYWVALVPFWAVWPYEVMLIPRRMASDLPSLFAEERDGLADIIKRLTIRYDNLFKTSFPYSMGWHGRPTDGGDHPYWRLHAVYYPPLLRSATVKKFLVGYEMTAEPQRDITPEQAAATLRGLPLQHYSQEKTI